MNGVRGIVLIALLILLCVSLPAFAQSDRGMITGTVVDSTGAVIPNAQVTISNLATGEVRKTKASAEGTYLFPEVPAATWKVKFEAAGFKPAETTVQVAVQTTRQVTAKLQVAGTAESVNVEASVAQIQTESPVLQTNVTERQVREMPLMVSSETAGRTPLSFIFLDSTVTSTTNRAQDAVQFRANGGQALGGEILVDGANTRRAQNGSFFSEVAPGPDAYQEFTISTSSYSAEYGNSSSGIVNFTLKSGTNKIHGEGYEYFRNEALNANTWMNNYNKVGKNRDRQNDFGFQLGGPVVIPKVYNGNNKTFWFFNYGGYRQNQGLTEWITVPTAKMRTGDFSEILNDPYVKSLGYLANVRIWDPHLDPSQRVYDPVNHIDNSIPDNRLDLYELTHPGTLDKAGLAILNAWPTPTQAGVYHNYLATSNSPNNMDSDVEKIDHILSDKQRLSFSHTYRKQFAVKGGYHLFPKSWTGVWDQWFKSHYARLSHDYTVSNTMLNHLNIGWNRVFVNNQNSTLGDNASKYGIPANSTANIAFPFIEFPWYGNCHTSTDPRCNAPIGSTWWNDHEGDNMLEIADSFTWARGKHTFKFGADIRIQQLNVFQNFDNGGHFNFIHEMTAGRQPIYKPDGTVDHYEVVGGWPTASLATGAAEWTWTTVTGIEPAWRYFNHSYFINDDYKVTSRLTLNLGLRYEIQTPRREAHNYLRGFDPTAMNPVTHTKGAIIGAGCQANLCAPDKSLIPTDFSDFAPRVGFAYSLNSKTVVRGGLGMFYSPFQYDMAAGFIGYRNNRRITPPAGMVASAYLSSYPATDPIDPNGQNLGYDMDYFDPNTKPGRTVQWSLDVQRELPNHFAMTLSYVGNKGTRLRSNFKRLNAVPLDALKLGWPILNKNINDVTAADRAYAQSVGITLPSSASAVYPGFNGNVGKALQPFPQYGYINNKMESYGQSWYHSGTLKIDRRFAQGLQFGASYTFSKLITTAADNLFGDTNLTGVLQNPYNIAALRSISPTNPNHVLVFNYIYELPFGKGKKFLNQGGILDKIIGGWQFNGIHRYQSGLPVTVSMVDGDARAFLDVTGFQGNLRPNLNGQEVKTNLAVTDWIGPVISPYAFSAPLQYSNNPKELVNGELRDVLPTDPRYGAYYNVSPLTWFGNAPAVIPNSRVAPYYSENWSLLKKFRMTESVTLELGGEAFNPFNRHLLWMPDTNLGHWISNPNGPGSWSNGNFGKSSVIHDPMVYGPRVLQVRARIVF